MTDEFPYSLDCSVLTDRCLWRTLLAEYMVISRITLSSVRTVDWKSAVHIML